MTRNRRNYWGTITAVYGTTTGTPPMGDPLVIRYDVVADEITDAEDAKVAMRPRNVLPLRRISRGAKILVAQVGDPCIICVRNGTVFVVAVTEGIPFVEACP